MKKSRSVKSIPPLPPPGRFTFRIIAGAFCGVFLCVALGGGGLTWYARSHVAGSLYLMQTPLAGLDAPRLNSLVDRELGQLEQSAITLVPEASNADGQVVTLADLGFSFDRADTAARLSAQSLALWKNSMLSPFFGLQASAAGDTARVALLPTFGFLKKNVEDIVLGRLSRYAMDPREPLISWSRETGWGITPSVSGRQLAPGELDRITSAIINGLLDPASSKTFYAKFIEVPPTHKPEDIQFLVEQLKRFTQPVEVDFGKDKEVIDVPSDALSWFEIDYDAPIIRSNFSKVAAFTADFATRHNIDPATVTLKSVVDKDSEYVKETYKKAVIEGDMKEGRTVDQEKLVLNLFDALTAPAPRKITVSFKRLPLKIVSEVPDMQFPELISEGASSYHLGNYKERVHNIKKGLELEDLTVLPAGEVFSYDKVLGHVTHANGFQDAQVIFGDILADVAGGGLCQTSTTAFRAAVMAGLPIVERRGHSWDVHYYRDVYGVDATIYPPGRVDLKFKNDTPGPILIHSYADTDTEMAYFDFYGTSDGRSVTLSLASNEKKGGIRKVINDWVITRADGTVENKQIISKYTK